MQEKLPLVVASITEESEDDYPQHWMQGSVADFLQLVEEEEEEVDVVDQLHAVVFEVTGYQPPAQTKEVRLPTIGFIQ